MSKCKDCKYWDRKSDTAKEEICEDVGDDKGLCLKVKFDGEKDNKMVAVDGSGYWACLLTSPEHGCLEFEAK